MIKYGCTFFFLFFMIFFPQSTINGKESMLKTTHALSQGSQPKYPETFTHFEYANPDAPKGGLVRLHAIGTFDTLNPYTLKGVPASGVGMTFETLMTPSADELDTQYGLIAQSVTIPKDILWAEYTLRKEARWHDGRPITPEDVIFTLDILKTKGHPRFRYYYASVKKGVKTGKQKVKFLFSEETNRELPTILGQLPVLPKHYFQSTDFTKTTLTPVLGSGPYRIKEIDAGKSVTYERVKDYWGKDLPVNKGHYNFDTIRYDYYRDAMIALEAFKAGEYDFRQENTAKNWALGYAGPALKKGWMKKEAIPHKMHQGTQGYIFNTRRWFFKDVRVRKALAHAFDFEWSNKTLFFGQYKRTRSYFTNSPWEAKNPPGKEELAILEPFRGDIPGEVFTKAFTPPQTDGSGRIRKNLKIAIAHLNSAGWELRKGKLFHKKNNQPFEFEILHNSPAFERISLPFKKNLSKLGITARVRTVDTSQYQKRMDDFDFDMTTHSFYAILSPGNEQKEYWGSSAADTKGSMNVAGVKHPVIDKLAEMVVTAPDDQSLLFRAKAFDRVLLFNYYIIPQWHISKYRVAYWDKFSRGRLTPSYSLAFTSWWVDKTKAEELQKKRGK